MPIHCHPLGCSKPCSECNKNSWECVTSDNACKVWGRVAVYDVHIYMCRCKECGKEISVDGPEYGMFRQDKKVGHYHHSLRDTVSCRGMFRAAALFLEMPVFACLSMCRMRLNWICFILGWGCYQPARLLNGDDYHHSLQNE